MAPRNAQFTREDIVDAAFALAREQGWSGFSVPVVAKRLNSSTMPVYSQFANVRELEDAVCRKAFELLKERMRERVTGDIWIDQGITYIRFAQQEKHLYRCMWDGRNPALQRECGEELWAFIDHELEGYPRFAGLTPQQFKLVRVTRSLMAQGLATAVNTDRKILQDAGVELEDYIARASLAIFEGLKLQFR